MKKKELFTLFFLFLIGFLIAIAPHSPDIPEKGWTLFAIFVSTLLGIMLRPLPTGAISIIALTMALLTNVLTFDEAFFSFKCDTVWLVVFAFFISRGFVKTGLGVRIAYYLVSLFGKRTLGLAYSLLASEAVLAPAIPSITARSGGIIFPIALGLSESFGSDPKKKTERNIGSFLMTVAYQGSAIGSTLFLTAMAANTFVANLTQDAGYTLSWGMWALAAIVPGILSLIVMPLVVYKVYPPLIKETPHAPEFARNHLKERGKFSQNEWLMLIVFLLLVFFWILSVPFHIKPTITAMAGLSLLLITKVLDWKDVLKEEHAWDTFLWFSILVTLSAGLYKLGFIPWVSNQVVGMVTGIPWVWAFLLLLVIYFYSHYFFASNSAHVGAMYPAFLMVIIGFGTPVNLAILSLAFASSLMGALTHYGSGPAPIYYGSGYVDVKNWWRVAFIVSVVNLLIWIGLGCLWWKFLGMW